MSAPTLTGLTPTEASTSPGGARGPGGPDRPARTGPPHAVRHLWRDHRTALVAVLAVLVLVALAVPIGLSALGGTSSATSAAASGGAGFDAPATSRDAGAAKGALAAGGAGGAEADLAAPFAPGAGATGVRIARSAWLGIEVADLSRASASARLVATSAGGQVTSENVVTATDPTGSYGAGGLGGAPSAPDLAPGSDGPGLPGVPAVGVDEARLTLSVPAGKLDGVVTELSRLGSVSYRSSSSEDVTDSYVDTRARIGPMQDSITSVRALLAKATDLQQVIVLENELTRRQSDLDSLTQRLAELDRRTTMSDVTATLWTSATAAAPQQGGVLAALVRAWDGFLGSATVILTGLAVLLPWLVVGLVITWLVWRRRGRRSRAAAGATVATPPTP